jgi:hypothetical protein
MALASTTVITASSDGTNQSSYATASGSPTANKLQLLAIANQKASAPDTPTVTGASMTWVQIATVKNDVDNLRLTVFRALNASPGTGALTIDYAGATQQNCLWKWHENTGNEDLTGSDGAGAVVQSVTGASSGASTTLTITLATFGDASNNMGIAFYATPANTTFAADTGGGWAETAAEVNNASPPTTLGDMWLLGGADLAATGTFGASQRVCGVAMEIKAATTATSWGPLLGGGLCQLVVNQ